MSFPRLCTVIVCLAGVLAAQSPDSPPFQIRVQSGGTSTTLDSGGTATLTAPGQGQTATASFTFTFLGPGSVTLPERPRIDGATDFSVSVQAEFPLVLQQSRAVAVTVQFRPTTSARATAQLMFPYSSGSGGTAGTVAVSLAGLTPDVVYAWVPQPEGNVTAVLPGGAISFPATLAGSASTVAVLVSNRGTAPLTVNSITTTGDAYRVAGLSLLPATVNPGSELRFNIRFAPVGMGAVEGDLRIGAGGQTASFRLSGTAIAPQLTYVVIREETISAVLPAETISFPSTSVGSSSRLKVRFTNQGTAEGRITSIAGSGGAAFEVTEIPVLPVVLAPGRSAEVGVVFTPSQPGELTGRLRVGEDFFQLSGVAIGAQFSYAYQFGTDNNTLAPGAPVIFPATDVGRTASMRFTISNTGTAAGTIGSVGLGSTGPVFSIPDMPALPLSLAPGERVTLTIAFAPNALGSATSTLRIGADSFPLSGISNNAVPLPAYRLESAESPEPLTQPAITLTLSEPYPLPLNGTLTVAGDDGSPPADPAVQFASGGRTVNFRIPANATQATFASLGSQVRLQTGTVAGALRLTPSFVTDGGLPVNSSDPATLQLAIAESAPRLISVQATAGETSLSVTMTGFATTRSIRQIQFQFAVGSGVSANATNFTVNVDGAFSNWYQSNQSRQVGSQFTATMPFTLQRTGTAGGPVVQAVQSVSVRLMNDRGNSETITVPVATQ